MPVDFVRKALWVEIYIIERSAFHAFEVAMKINRCIVTDLVVLDRDLAHQSLFSKGSQRIINSGFRKCRDIFYEVVVNPVNGRMNPIVKKVLIDFKPMIRRAYIML